MALTLSELKKPKIKKESSDSGSVNSNRIKLSPYQSVDTSTVQNTHISSPLNDKAAPSDPLDISKADDFKESQKTSNKLVTNSTETSNNCETKLVTKESETSNKLVTKIDVKSNLSNLDEETSNKLVTNSTETSNNCETKLVTKESETSNKLVTKIDVKSNLSNLDEKTSNKLVTNSTETSNTTSNKTSNKSPNFVTSLSNENSALDLDSLSGLKRQILSYIFERCYKNINLNKTNNTGPLTKEQLSEYTGKNANVIHVYLHRLMKDNLIIRISAKEGRGGYSIFTLPQNIYQEILYSQGIETSNKLVTQLVTQLVTTPPSKLVSNINNTNYLTEEVETKSAQTQDLAVAHNTGWFKTLDFSALTYIKPMMVNSAIRSLVESKLDQDDVQMFVNKFKNWLATQRNIQNPLAIFCDKLKEYANEGDSPVLGVMSDEELQIELLMAQELEKSRLELELVNKARLFKAEQEKEARFQNWLLQASDDEKKALYPETGFARIGSEIYNIGLKEAFFNQKQIEG